MRILVSGASGLIGSALAPFLRSERHEIVPLARSSSAGQPAVAWDPGAGRIDADALEGFDAVVHLAGENIVGRWTAKKKAAIRNSRVRGTRMLAQALASRVRKPAVLLCASAIGYYGHRGDEVVREGSGPGSDFLADVCRDWEAAADPARQAGIRTVHLRFGMVLSASGGALAKMVPAFRLGLGGVLGSGRQYMSWVDLDDVLGAIRQGLTTVSVAGPVNVVAPHPVTNAEFTKTLGRALKRPTPFPVPAFAARMLFGELADALLFSSTRVEPAKLLQAGYRFRYPELEASLRHLLNR